MERYRYKIDNTDDEYLTFTGRWFDYIYGNDKPKYALRIGETADYFYFTITLLYEDIQQNFIIDIDESNLMYYAFDKLMDGFKLLDVMEEGTPERKSLQFVKRNKKIQLIFKNIPVNKGCFCTIEFANVRRWGDTRFANVISTTDKDFANNLQKMGDFRYEFKGRLHEVFNNLEEVFKTKAELLQK